MVLGDTVIGVWEEGFQPDSSLASTGRTRVKKQSLNPTKDRVRKFLNGKTLSTREITGKMGKNAEDSGRICRAIQKMVKDGELVSTDASRFPRYKLAAQETQS